MLKRIEKGLHEYYVAPYRRSFARAQRDEDDLFMLLVFAESMGVPTLRLKLISTTVMGGLMGMAGAPFPYFITFVEPVSAFNLLIAVNAIAVPMIGGTASWIGPVIGGLLLGIIQETVTVNISSELNMLIVGVVLVGFISLAPQGIVGLYQDFMRKRRKRND